MTQQSEAPCSFCTSLTEEETELFWREGADAVM